jgi:hypothetical protein
MEKEQSQMQFSVDLQLSSTQNMNTSINTSLPLPPPQLKRKASKEPEDAQEIERRKENIQLEEEEKENNKNNNKKEITSLDPMEEAKSELKHINFGEFSDFVIKYQDTAFQVHKFVLNRESEYFVKWFNMHKEEKELIIEPIVSEVKSGVLLFASNMMHRFINLMYSTSDEQAIDHVNLPFTKVHEWQGPLIGLCSYFCADKVRKRIVVAIERYLKLCNGQAYADHLILLKYMNAYSFFEEKQLLIDHIAKDKTLKNKLTNHFVFRQAWRTLHGSLREPIMLNALGMTQTEIELILTQKKKIQQQ